MILPAPVLDRLIARTNDSLAEAREHGYAVFELDKQVCGDFDFNPRDNSHAIAACSAALSFVQEKNELSRLTVSLRVDFGFSEGNCVISDDWKLHGPPSIYIISDEAKLMPLFGEIRRITLGQFEMNTAGYCLHKYLEFQRPFAASAAEDLFSRNIYYDAFRLGLQRPLRE